MRAAFLIILLASPLPAQLTEKIEVRITSVDAVVTDKQGNRVTGLTRDDFEVFEGGKPQAISNFYEVRPDDAEVPAVVKQRRIVIFVDNASIQPLRRNEVFASIDTALQKLLQPGDEASIIYWNQVARTIVPFTGDIERLRAATKAERNMAVGGAAFPIEQARVRNTVTRLYERAREPGTRIPADVFYREALAVVRSHAESLFMTQRALLQSMEQVVSSMAGADGRKLFVVVGSHLANQPALELYQYVDQLFISILGNRSPVGALEASQRNTAEFVRAVADKANAAGVTIYVIQATDGVGGRGVSADSDIGESEDFVDFTNSAASFGRLARVTGGVALYRTNGFDRAIQTLTSDLDAYYSLGYRSPDGVEATRRIAVKVKRPELNVRTRLNYRVKRQEERIEDKVMANLHTSVGGEIPITLATGQPTATENNIFRVPYVLTIPPHLTFVPEGNELAAGFWIYIVVGTDDGAVSKVRKQHQPVRVPSTMAESVRQQNIVYNGDILVRKGEQVLSIGVVDDATSAAGYAKARVSAE